MKKALVIINGIHFPYALLDASIQWAKENDGEIHIEYNTADKEGSDTYSYPNDMDELDITSESDAEQDDERIIASQVKLAKDSAVAENIACTVDRQINGTMGDLIEKANNFDIVFLDGAYPEPAPLLANEEIDLQKLSKKLTCPVQFVASY